VGCGVSVAQRLVTHGYGNTLCSAARMLERVEFENFLVKWCENVRNFLCQDPVGSMGSRHPALAAAMPDTFPNREILLLYVFPITSSDDVIKSFNSGYCLPDVVEIARVCELYFPWAVPRTILAKFSTNVFPAVLVAVLKEEVVRRESNSGQKASRIPEVNIGCSRYCF
jgi:Holliday junction resolvase YEN1